MKRINVWIVLLNFACFVYAARAESGGGGFDIDLKWAVADRYPLNPEALIQAVREQLGLELTQAKRRIEVLVVESRKPNEK